LANDDENAMLYHRKGIETLRRSADAKTLASAILNMGEAFRMAGNYDSALHYFAEAEQIFGKINYPKGKFYSIGNIGMVYASQGKTGLAENDLNQAIDFLEASDDYYPVCVYLISLSDVYLQKNKIDKALSYAKRSWQLAQQHDLKEQIRDADLKLSELYQKDHDPEQAFNFYKQYIAARDSINNINNVQEMANLRTNFEVAQKQKEVNVLHQQKYMQKVLLIVALAVIAIIVLLIIILLRNYRQKQTAYALLSKQKDISEQQREQIDKSLQQLKRTQAHLIQSEKMASLGQLTAGIAHEIQNPMNFVNNFSDLNAELIAELQEEHKKGNDEAVQSIAKDILENSGKISYHGRRVDGIVKSMLEHSRSGTPEKRLTNINNLADEYFRLAFSGVKAKDKDFTATMQKDLDPDAGEINIVPQEVGRVIFNLAINAFHSVAAKSVATAGDYNPTVSVRTKKENNQLLLSVKDNGTGIPPALQNKIFEPFFTTKATGFGVGLGLSISYDIIKAHGGEIKVQSEEGKGSEFIVILPYENDI
jgi:signal transduction histidine kinase